MTLQEIKERWHDREFDRGYVYDSKTETVWVLLKSGKVLELDAMQLCENLRNSPYMRRQRVWNIGDFLMQFVVPLLTTVGCLILIWKVITLQH